MTRKRNCDFDRCGREALFRRGTRRMASAFTLVELLVVIGIIGLLVAILLPALNKARQQANLVTCQTHLRQLGQAIDLYAHDNKGLLPYGYWNGNANPNIYDATKAGDWSTLVSNELSSRLGSSYDAQGTTGGWQSFNRGVFLDVDGISGHEGLDYSCHPRLMPNVGNGIASDPTIYKANVPYKLAHVQRSSEIVLILCGVQIAYNYNSIGGKPDANYWGASATAFSIDAWRFLTSTGTVKQDYLLYQYPTADDGTPINPGANVDNGAIAPDYRAGNAIPFVTYDGDIRWRHMNNSAANFLFVDGHVEAHFIQRNPGGAQLHPPQPYKTDLLGKNIDVNP
ncbi:MAG: type II secretion system protein [Tepidisphaeraceae bacterium]